MIYDAFISTQLIVFLGETTEEIFEINFISDRNKTDIGFYASFTIIEIGVEGNETNETTTEVSNYIQGRIDQHTFFSVVCRCVELCMSTRTRLFFFPKLYFEQSFCFFR